MMETPGLRKGGDRVALLSSAETIPAPPGPAHSRFPGAPCSHRAILEPVLEVLAPRLGPAHILAALGGDPLDQDLLQVHIVLFLSLLLHLLAQAVGRSPVGHSKGWRQWLWGAGERTQPARPVVSTLQPAEWGTLPRGHTPYPSGGSQKGEQLPNESVSPWPLWVLPPL